jgi:hypothetical protein
VAASLRLGQRPPAVGLHETWFARTRHGMYTVQLRLQKKKKNSWTHKNTWTRLAAESLRGEGVDTGSPRHPPPVHVSVPEETTKMSFSDCLVHSQALLPTGR